MSRRKKSKKRTTTDNPTPLDDQPQSTIIEGLQDMSVRNFFHRMKTVGQLIHKGFGLDKVQDADVITKNAYLVVVSRIIEALSREEELSTAELATLSKTLAEQRRLEIADKEIERKFTKDESAPPTPREVTGTLRNLYGTENLNASESNSATANGSIPKGGSE